MPIGALSGPSGSRRSVRAIGAAAGCCLVGAAESRGFGPGPVPPPSSSPGLLREADEVRRFEEVPIADSEVLDTTSADLRRGIAKHRDAMFRESLACRPSRHHRQVGPAATVPPVVHDPGDGEGEQGSCSSGR